LLRRKWNLFCKYFGCCAT